MVKTLHFIITTFSYLASNHLELQKLANFTFNTKNHQLPDNDNNDSCISNNIFIYSSLTNNNREIICRLQGQTIIRLDSNSNNYSWCKNWSKSGFSYCDSNIIEMKNGYDLIIINHLDNNIQYVNCFRGNRSNDDNINNNKKKISIGYIINNSVKYLFFGNIFLSHLYFDIPYQQIVNINNSNNENLYHYQNNNKITITLDYNIFRPLSSIEYLKDMNSNFIYDNNYNMKPKFIINKCRDISLSFLPKKYDNNICIPFTLISDDTSYINNQWNLKYWIDLCGISPSTAYTWKINNDHNNYNSNNNSSHNFYFSKYQLLDYKTNCKIKYYQNIKEEITGFNVCLEDFLNFHNKDNNSNNNDNNNSIPIYYLSPLGLNPKNDNNNIYYTNVMISELTEVIRSFISSNKVHLVINTISHHSSYPENNSKYLNDIILDLLLIYSSDENSEILWEKKINELIITLTTSNDEEAVIKYYELLEVINKFIYDSSNNNIKICKQNKSFSLFCLAPYYTKFLDILEKYTTISRRGNKYQIAYISSLIKLIKKSIKNGINSITTDNYNSDRSKNLVFDTSYYINLDGDTIVFIFVIPSQMEIAQHFVNKWQKDCSCKICFAFIKYVIIPIPNDDARIESCLLLMESNKDSNDYKFCVKLLLARKPPLRVVVNTLKELISASTSKHDIVFILVGVESLFRYYQPCSSEGTGAIPFVNYGSMVKYSLYSNITTADYTIDSVVGTCKHIVKMLESIMDQPDYIYANDESIRKIIKQYIKSEGKIIKIDNNYLNFKRVDHLMDNLVESIVRNDNYFHQVNANGDIATVEPSLQFFINSFRNKTIKSSNNEFEKRMRDVVFPLMSIDNFQYIYDNFLLSNNQWSYLFQPLQFPELNMKVIGEKCISNQFSSMKVIIDFISDLITRGNHWIEAHYFIIYILTKIRECPDYHIYEDILLCKLNELAKQDKIANREIPIDEFLHISKLLYAYHHQIQSFVISDIIQQYNNNCSYFEIYNENLDNQVKVINNKLLIDTDKTIFLDDSIICQVSDINSNNNNVKFPLFIGIISGFQETADFNYLMTAMYDSLLPVSYSVLSRRRNEWLQQKSRYDKIISLLKNKRTLKNTNNIALYAKIDKIIKVHYFTYSSDNKNGLENLILTSKLVGVDLKILGLGEEYRDYSDKIVAYNKALQDKDLDENDIVVLLDAYDILLFPYVLNLVTFMSQAPTPIVFCSENGIYPEFAPAFVYHRNNDERVNFRDVSKFLNSGCIIGRIGQVRVMFTYIMNRILKVRDDQQIYIRYMLENPDMVSFDYNNEMTLSTHKEYSSLNKCNLTVDLLFTYNHKPIGIVHFNNKKANNFYSIFVDYINSIVTNYFNGFDAENLLECIRNIYTNDYDIALNLLELPIIKNNRTSYGGFNIIGDYLYLVIVNKLQIDNNNNTNVIL